MNINLVTSFIIAGILLLILGYMNIGVGNNANEVVLSQAKQSQKLDIQEIISYDFPKIGYDFTNSADSLISKAKDDRIEFYSNLDNSADGSVEKIIWRFTGLNVTETDNPNDKILVRSVDGVDTEIKVGVTLFKLEYFDQIGSLTPMATPIPSASLSTIRQVQVTLRLESAEEITNSQSGNREYISTLWVKRFTPRNL